MSAIATGTATRAALRDPVRVGSADTITARDAGSARRTATGLATTRQQFNAPQRAGCQHDVAGRCAIFAARTGRAAISAGNAGHVERTAGDPRCHHGQRAGRHTDPRVIVEGDVIGNQDGAVGELHRAANADLPGDQRGVPGGSPVGVEQEFSGHRVHASEHIGGLLGHPACRQHRAEQQRQCDGNGDDAVAYARAARRVRTHARQQIPAGRAPA
jgi:hypothetical protein